MIILKNKSHSDVIVGGVVVLGPREQKEFDEKGKDKLTVSKLIRKGYIDSLTLIEKPTKKSKKSISTK